MKSDLNRRDWLALTPTALATALATGRGQSVRAATGPDGRRESSGPFRYCLNTSTIRGQALSIVDEVELAARVGYDAIEPWVRELDEFVKNGGSLEDLGRRIADSGLTVESAIGFPEWAVEDEARRRKGLDEARRNMEMVQKIGGRRLAAPPVGLTDVENVDLSRVTERLRVLLELGDEMNVTPQLEVWGFSKTLSRLGEAALVVTEVGHPSACLLADVYHLYKGGSSFVGMRQIHWGSSHVFHMNDYPDVPREAITDADRVFPGDGVAPLPLILRNLYETGFRGALSLELFNRSYWEQDAMDVARRGLETMKQAVEAANLPG